MFIGTEKRVFLFQIRTPDVAGNVLSMDVALSSMIPCELPQSWRVLKKRKTNVAIGTVHSITHACVLRDVYTLLRY